MLHELESSQRFVDVDCGQGRLWKDELEHGVRRGYVALGIRRRGMHGFRGAAACEFVAVKHALGFTEGEARKELAMWLGHNPHRTEVTYAYVPQAKS